MKENPYSSLIKIMQKEGKKEIVPSIKIGRVVYIEEIEDKILDIKIEVDDLIVDKDNIYISENLLKFYKKQIEIKNIENKQDVYKENINIENKKIDIVITDSIKKDDLISVMPVKDKQTYILLSKVVKLDG